MTKAEAKKARKSLLPFLPIAGDPADFWGDDQKPNSNYRVKQSLRSKHKKPLKIKRFRRIIKSTIKRKDGKMAIARKINIKPVYWKTLAWLLFAAQQAYEGIVLLQKSDNYFVVVVAIISLLIAGSVVTANFYKAQK